VGVGRYELLRDPGRALTIDTIDEVEPGRWQRVSDPSPNFGFTSAAVWGRVRLVNPGAAPAVRRVVFRYPLLDRVELYVPRPDGAFDRAVNGDMLRYSERPFDTHVIQFEVTLPPGETLAFFRVTTDSSLQIGFDVMTPARQHEVESTWLFIHGGYYGLMLALGLYNFFLFLSIRTRAYLWYVVYVVVFTGTQMGLDGTAGRFLFPENPDLANRFTPLTIAALLSPPLLFAQHFLDTRRHVPRLHRAIDALVIISLVPLAVAMFGPYAVAIRLAAATVMFVCTACLAVGVVVWRRGYRPARFYVLAWSTVLFGTIAYALVSFGVLPANLFFSNIQRIGSVLEVILLSFALGDHISTINAERDAARTAAFALERDLAVTGAVQRLFLPRQDSYASPALALRGYYAPAAQCGGDWWWYERTADGGVRVLLGDVTGHGVGAAMVTAGVAAAYRALPEAARTGDVRRVIGALNDSLTGICGGSHHMTLGALDIDPRAGEVRMWSAGAPAALVMRGDGTIEHVAAAGSPLGAADVAIGEDRRAIHPGDRIFVFSDGLHELVVPGGRQLGYRGVSRMLARTRGMARDEAHAAIAAEVRGLLAGGSQVDDIAFVLIDVVDRAGAEQAA
jgi:serine phosphatase RsbU (regulator of sigma subunit)